MTDARAAGQGEEVVVRRALPVPVPRVWRAWTDAEEFAAWIWPPRFETDVALDPQPGGRLRFRSEVAEMGVTGEFAEVDEPRLLAFTWRWDGEDVTTAVAVRLDAADEGTALTLLHGGFRSAEERDVHEQGWNDCLDRLPDVIRG